MKPLCVSKQAFLISQTIRKSKLIEIITSVVHVSSFDETHSSTGRRGTPFPSWLHQIHVYIGQQQRSSNFTRLSITKKKKLDYYQGHSSVSNDKNKNDKS
jgi:hypothetical protein